jgi:hypothetical protein
LSTLPTALLGLLDKIREMQMPRQPITIEALSSIKETGMSPKKAHEVSRMAAYVLEIIKSNDWDPDTLQIVDVGAGQVRKIYAVQMNRSDNAFRFPRAT